MAPKIRLLLTDQETIALLSGQGTVFSKVISVCATYRKIKTYADMSNRRVSW